MLRGWMSWTCHVCPEVLPDQGQKPKVFRAFVSECSAALAYADSLAAHRVSDFFGTSPALLCGVRCSHLMVFSLFWGASSLPFPGWFGG